MSEIILIDNRNKRISHLGVLDFPRLYLQWNQKSRLLEGSHSFRSKSKTLLSTPRWIFLFLLLIKISCEKIKITLPYRLPSFYFVGLLNACIVNYALKVELRASRHEPFSLTKTVTAISPNVKALTIGIFFKSLQVLRNNKDPQASQEIKKLKPAKKKKWTTTKTTKEQQNVSE